MQLSRGTISFLFALLITSFFLDQNICRLVDHLPASEGLNTLRDLSNLGKALNYIVACALLTISFYFLGRSLSEHRWKSHFEVWTRYFGFALFSFCFSGLSVVVIKWLIGRARPISGHEFANVFSPLSFSHLYQSFPSGHTQVAFTFAFLIGLRFRTFLIPAVLYASFVGLSRVLWNAHYFSDVIGGIIIAYFGVWLSEKVFDHFVGDPLPQRQPIKVQISL